MLVNDQAEGQVGVVRSMFMKHTRVGARLTPLFFLLLVCLCLFCPLTDVWVSSSFLHTQLLSQMSRLG